MVRQEIGVIRIPLGLTVLLTNKNIDGIVGFQCFFCIVAIILSLMFLNISNVQIVISDPLIVITIIIIIVLVLVIITKLRTLNVRPIRMRQFERLLQK